MRHRGLIEEGQRVWTLVDVEETVGVHRLEWDGRNQYGNFYRMRAGETIKTRKMVRVR